MKKYVPLTLLVFFVFSQAYSQSIGQYLENDWNQFKRNVNKNTLLYSGGWLAGMYALSFGDEYLNNEVKSLNKGYLNYYFKAIDNLGYAPVAIPLSVGIGGISFLTKDRKFRNTALTSVESMAVTACIVYTLKIGIGRSRPDAKQGARSFNPFSGWDDSFASGHTSTAFALITPWIYYYKKPWTYFLFIFPASTALSRMIYDRHWATDVLTGGIIGYAVGFYLTKWHKSFNKSHKSMQNPPTITFTIPM